MAARTRGDLRYLRRAPRLKWRTLPTSVAAVHRLDPWRTHGRFALQAVSEQRGTGSKVLHPHLSLSRLTLSLRAGEDDPFSSYLFKTVGAWGGTRGTATMLTVHAMSLPSAPDAGCDAKATIAAREVECNTCFRNADGENGGMAKYDCSALGVKKMLYLTTNCTGTPSSSTMKYSPGKVRQPWCTPRAQIILATHAPVSLPRITTSLPSSLPPTHPPSRSQVLRRPYCASFGLGISPNNPTHAMRCDSVWYSVRRRRQRVGWQRIEVCICR